MTTFLLIIIKNLTYEDFMKTALEILKESDKEKIKYEGQLTISYGAISSELIPENMPPSHEQWDILAKQLPTLIGNMNVRQVLNKMLVLSAAEVDLPEKYLARASLILNSLAHAYYYHDRVIPVSEREKKDPLPIAIELPWQQVTKRLQRVVTVPSRTIFDSVLYNWKLRNPIKPFDLKKITLEDLEMSVPMLGNAEESIFFLTITLM